MSKVDASIHQPIRLKNMKALNKLPATDEADFTFLKRLLDVTDGKLGAHLLKLEQAGYNDVKKEFVNRKPKTFIRASGKGRDAFDAHVRVLRYIVDSE